MLDHNQDRRLNYLQIMDKLRDMQGEYAEISMRVFEQIKINNNNF